MTLQELQDELQKDLQIDPTKLEYESSQNPVLYGKWLVKYSSLKKEVIRIDNDRKTSAKERLDFYTGRSEGQVCFDRYERSEMKTVVSADETILKLDTKLQYMAIMLEFCSTGMDAIKQRGFAIKHMIEMRQFEAGK
ncbi:recombination, repair and ssDNA binding protein [Pseudomonas phage PspYZU05]|uniref:Recombination, repair and ssDNA binding protein n=1 Tax=Pseudomonas phage PspYZU05 TaxID=1983556 RepID=A0A2U7NBV4_9CAUD|nr:recombination, repair and ssDNA binding protein [Pseudomonas phage PspYZU05]ASD52099.1 recombination, repair and ssDNA binding protein [Pseudomonas phage PspYZU05]